MLLICNEMPNYSAMAHDVVDMMNHLFMTWDGFSGSVQFPVPCPDREHNPWEGRCNAYDSCPPYHYFDPETEYGLLRLDLLDHMIEELEKHV